MGNQTSSGNSPDALKHDSPLRRSNYFRKSNFRSGGRKKKKPACPGTPKNGSFRSSLKSPALSSSPYSFIGSPNDTSAPITNRFHGDVGRMTPKNLDHWKLVTPPQIGGQLIVKNINFHSLMNRGIHSTEEYKTTDLIIRRGQPFQITLHLDRPYNEKQDELIIHMRTGMQHKISDCTLVLIPIVKNMKNDDWSAEIKNVDSDFVSMMINCPVDALIGRYRLMVKTKVTRESLPNRECIYEHSEAVYVLFNPWCKDDAVYLNSDAERKEYIKCDTGFIWFGTHKQRKKRAWDYAQFDENVLKALMYIIESKVQISARKDPVKLCQILTNVLTGHNEFGVMECRWDDQYSFAVPPTTWNSSRVILEEYMKTQRAVKFGQCWTLACLLTTMCRSIGIPARCVTSYNCNHDSEHSLSINVHFDSSTNQLIENLNDKPLWLFHVWNEVWMTRSDLPRGYDGWQALDATPQETSKGLCCTGPVSLNAVKQGHLYYPYDTNYFFTSINSCRTFWSCVEEFGVHGEMTVTRQEAVSGQVLCTKAVGKDEDEDITHLYKHPQGSKELTMSLHGSSELGIDPVVEASNHKQTHDVSTEIQPDDDVTVGGEFDVTVTMHNLSSEERNIKAKVIVITCFYTGVTKARCKEELLNVKLKPKEVISSVVHIAASDYMMKLADHSYLKVYLHGTVEETMQKTVCQADMCLARPELHITLKNTEALKADDIFFATFQFMNPVSIALTNCKLTIDGCGIEKLKPVEMPDIEPFQNLKTKMKLRVIKGGHQTLIAGFTSDQINNVTGYIEMDIERLV